MFASRGNRSRWLIVGIAVAAAIYPVGAAADKTRIIDPPLSNLIFSEDFDRLDVSARGPGTQWTAHTPWNGDFGDAKFVDPKPGFPFMVENGVMKIEARKGPGNKWQSGLLSSTNPKGAGFAQLDGYFEIRARFPPGEGLWPAFWLASRGEKTAVEVDVVEHYGHFPALYTASLHIWDRKVPKLSKSFHQRVSVPAGSLYADFHTYGVAVEAQRITYFFDRQEVWSVDRPAELQLPFTLLLDLGLGAGWPIDKTPNPSIMEVDYVRVWSLSDN